MPCGHARHGRNDLATKQSGSVQAGRPDARVAGQMRTPPCGRPLVVAMHCSPATSGTHPSARPSFARVTAEAEPTDARQKSGGLLPTFGEPFSNSCVRVGETGNRASTVLGQRPAHRRRGSRDSPRPAIRQARMAGQRRPDLSLAKHPASPRANRPITLRQAHAACLTKTVPDTGCFLTGCFL